MSGAVIKSLLMLSLLATAGWLLYPHDPAYRGTRVIPWRQPDEASVGFPSMAPYLISQQVVRRADSQGIHLEQWTFDFAALERHFAQSLPPGKPLVLNDKLRRQFQSVLQDLPASLSPASVERISFLFRKSFPGNTGRQLAVLYEQIYRFQHERAAAATRIAQLYPAGGPAQTRALLDSEEALQRKYFTSEQVTKLFGKQNALSRYLLQRRLVREDPELSPEQKRLALRDLQGTFEVVK